MLPPPSSGYEFTGPDHERHDIYPAISVKKTPSLRQEGKVILITGAGRGIGRAIALEYALAGISGIIIVARSSDQLSEVESSIKAINSSIKVLKTSLDVRSNDAVTNLAKTIEADFGRLDVLINNAGVTDEWKSLPETDAVEWWNTIEVNTKAPYLFLRSLLPLLASTARRFGTMSDVINMSSIGANFATPGASAYCMSKLALDMLTEFVVMEFGEDVVCVSAHPGGVPTALASAVSALDGLLVDTPELCGGWCVWMTAGARKWLSGRYVSATWDVDRLESMKEDILKGDKLKKRLVI
ncbi:NAD(P)-binding protein [Massarina eburnea CBS 473.64]|uniref:NAD(P)-binding protein n=1 Tax=Massarina eburnea CBS 473.64 TaxID=1395130 RepID=A0A6A6SDL8_9PLEO|nr:NAD(P)-binding protein [Massarina eburnea CBS 473.64]